MAEPARQKMPNEPEPNEVLLILRRLEPALARLDDRVGKLDDRVGKLEASVAKLDDRLRVVEGDVRELKGRVSQLPTSWQMLTAIAGIFAAAFAFLRPSH